MGIVLQTSNAVCDFPVRRIFNSLLLSLALMLAALTLGAPPPRPPKPPAPNAADRITDLQGRIDSLTVADATARRALDYSRSFLADAKNALHSGWIFKADRLTDAVDALLHVAEHQDHLRSHDRDRAPEPPPPGPRDRLQRAYFRTQQADYFAAQCKDARVSSFPKWARDFYQLAVRANERQDEIAMEENAKSAEDIVRALENLAQAASTAPVPSAPTGPPAPPAAPPRQELP